MSGLRDLLDSYLATRRALGFKLTAPGKTLDAFVGWMEEAGEPTIRRDLATAWAAQFSRGTVLERLNYVRQFAEHVAWFDPATEVPVLDGRPYGAHRPRPRIFTDQQIDTRLAAAGGLGPQARAASWQTLLGLLPVTGMRIDQLLTSEHFGLGSTDDPEVTELWENYYRLMGLKKPSKEQTDRLERVRARLDELEQFGTTERERLLLTSAADYIAQRRETGDAVAPSSKEMTAKLSELWGKYLPGSS